MTALALSLVLAAAFVHASWNYFLKRSGGDGGRDHLPGDWMKLLISHYQVQIRHHERSDLPASPLRYRLFGKFFFITRSASSRSSFKPSAS